MLRELGIEVLSHVIAVGSARLEKPVTWEAIVALAAKEEVLLGCADPEAEARMKEQVDIALRTGDSVGGIFEVDRAQRSARSGHLCELGRAP